MINELNEWMNLCEITFKGKINPQHPSLSYPYIDLCLKKKPIFPQFLIIS